MIGILDSGVGGLSVLNEIRRRLPGHAVVYVGDSAWCPYGTKEPEDIRNRCRTICDFLGDQGAEIIVIACNSATIAAIEILRTEYPLPFVGMEPAVKPAAQASRSGVIGILATEASLQGEKFHRLVSTHAGGVRVITQPCPKFVELVEAGTLEGSEVDAAIDEYTGPILKAGADVLILGCTHYPFLSRAIRARLPDGVQLIDTGEAVARRVESLAGPAGDGSTTIYTTGDLARLEALLPKLGPGLDATCHRLALD
ncbi:MAG: glutamate racemase [Akkermansiaceae bacterium]|nr:glutamate racemase [Akkermansiaceae bacterium]NNM28011.1 glutamate racemase [Akkermansiaceae bacterium]